jgi:hypothetical protein
VSTITTTASMMTKNNSNKNKKKKVVKAAKAVTKEVKKLEKKMSNLSMVPVRAQKFQNVSMNRRVKMAMYTPDEAKLALMWEDPFDPRCFGARVIDEFNIATTTRVLRGTSTIVADGGGAFNLVLCLHPYLGAIVLLGSFSTYMQSYANSSVKTNTNTTVLDSVFSSWRYVGGGFRLKNLQPLTSMTGKIIATRVAGVDFSGLAYNILANVSMSLDRYVRAVCGVGLSAQNGNTTSTLLELPEAEDLPIDAFINNSLLLNGHPLTKGCFDYKPAFVPEVTVDAGTSDWDTAVIVNDGTGAVTKGGVNIINMKGMPVFLLYGTGFPLNANIFELETIMHLEGTPQLAFQAGGAGIPIQPDCRKPNGDIGRMEQLLKVVNKEKMVTLIADVAETAGNHLIANGFGTRVRQLTNY